MDTSSALILGAAPILAGAGVLFYVWRCWSGRSRRWATQAFTNQLVYAILPGLGALFVAFGVMMLVGGRVGDVVMTAAVVVCLLGLVVLVFEPRWWGPRWYHDLRASNPQPDLQDPLTALATGATTPAPLFSSQAEAAEALGGTAVARWRGNYVHDPDARHREHGLAAPGTVGGHLLLYPGGLAFAASAFEDRLRERPTVVVVPATEVITARVVPARAGTDGVVRKGIIGRSLYPRLVVDTQSGSLLFDVVGAKAKAAKILQTLGRQA
jgi:hypothetical protein